MTKFYFINNSARIYKSIFSWARIPNSNKQNIRHVDHKRYKKRVLKLSQIRYLKKVVNQFGFHDHKTVQYKLMHTLS